MSSNSKSDKVNRREFLAGATTAGMAAAGLGKPGEATAQTADEALMAASPPHSQALEFEGELPEGYSAAEAADYFIQRPGSDFMVDVVKSLNLEYITTNPGSSFRGIHESIVNYGGNSAPELLTCPHEEQAVAMAHGYAKVAGKPIGVLCHGTVGLAACGNGRLQRLVRSRADGRARGQSGSGWHRPPPSPQPGVRRGFDRAWAADRRPR